WADASSIISTICVRAALNRDLATAWTRFAPHIEAVLAARSPVDEYILAMLLYACHGGSEPRTLDPDPLVVEPRFVELAAQLRRHEGLGASARMILRVLPRQQAVAAIERHPQATSAPPRVSLPARRDYLARYLAGEHAAWDELVTHAVAIAQHAELRDEARAVATELMKRVRHNTDAVRATLREAGAAIVENSMPARDEDLAPYQRLIGTLPIALDVFWRPCGSASLIPAGKDPYHYGPCALESDGISLIALDPLEVPSASELTCLLGEYEERVAESHPEIVGPFALEFAP